MSYNQHQAQGYQQSQGYQLPVYPPQPPRPGTTQYSSQYGSETALRERQDGPNETDHDAGVNTNTPSAGNGNSKTSPWKPNALARLPWKGLLEVALSVCCVFPLTPEWCSGWANNTTKASSRLWSCCGSATGNRSPSGLAIVSRPPYSPTLRRWRTAFSQWVWPRQ